jgi:hypothetical protein
MNIDVNHQNQDEKLGSQRREIESRADRTALRAWRKPVIAEASCGLEINCYATSTGSQQRR